MLIKYVQSRKAVDIGLVRAGSARSVGVMLAAWVIAMLSIPAAERLYGEAGLRSGVTAAVILQASTVLLILYYAWGARRTAWTAVVVIVLAWGAEAIGSATGVPFGAYAYTDKLQPQLARVPLVVALAWLTMLPSAWAVAYCVTGSTRGPAFVLLSALAFTVWDLFVDPQMAAWGLWAWEQPSGYFGTPWANYLGWLLVSALMTTLARPRKLPVGPLLLIYAATWALETVGLLTFWGLLGPALAGFMGMGGMLLWAWRAKTPR